MAVLAAIAEENPDPVSTRLRAAKTGVSGTSTRADG
jgi:hypothetical protein